MASNQERLERLSGLLQQASAVLEKIDLTPRQSEGDIFIGTLKANVDNEALSDAEFRAFVRHSLRPIKKG